MVDDARLRAIVVPEGKAAPRLLYMAYGPADKPPNSEFMLFECCEPCKVSLGPVRRSKYVAVYENKIEFTEPDCVCLPITMLKNFLCCNCFSGRIRISDNPKVIYFDRAIIQNAAKAETCSPWCTHNELWPDSCGACGEAVVLHTHDRVCCGTVHCGEMCKWHVVDQSTNDHHQHPFQMGLLGCLVCCIPHVIGNVFSMIFGKSSRIIRGVDDAKRLADEINAARNNVQQRFGPVIPGLTREEAQAQLQA